MKVFDRFYVTGRGWAVCLEPNPPGIVIGVILHAADGRSWRVSALERMGMSLPPVSYLLSGDEPPEIGCELG
jgi:hypothetical protein